MPTKIMKRKDNRGLDLTGFPALAVAAWKGLTFAWMGVKAVGIWAVTTKSGLVVTTLATTAVTNALAPAASTSIGSVTTKTTNAAIKGIWAVLPIQIKVALALYAGYLAASTISILTNIRNSDPTDSLINRSLNKIDKSMKTDLTGDFKYVEELSSDLLNTSLDAVILALKSQKLFRKNGRIDRKLTPEHFRYLTDLIYDRIYTITSEESYVDRTLNTFNLSSRDFDTDDEVDALILDTLLAWTMQHFGSLYIIKHGDIGLIRQAPSPVMPSYTNANTLLDIIAKWKAKSDNVGLPWFYCDNKIVLNCNNKSTSYMQASKS